MDSRDQANTQRMVHAQAGVLQALGRLQSQIEKRARMKYANTFTAFTSLRWWVIFVFFLMVFCIFQMFYNETVFFYN